MENKNDRKEEKNGDRKEEKKEKQNSEETWNEIYTVTVDESKKLAIIEDITVEREKVDEDRVAICDYCNSQMGKFRELKKENFISPEMFTKAIKNGLIPPEEQLIIFKSLGNEEFLTQIIENWKVMAMQSQTPWAVCSKCRKNIDRYLKN